MRPVATVYAIPRCESKPNVSLVKLEICDDLFKSVPSRSKKIKSIKINARTICYLCNDV